MNSPLGWIKPKAQYFLVVAAAFFAYQLYLLINSFPAIYRIYHNAFSGNSLNDQFWSRVWFSSEFIGEIGLIVRFAGSCFLVTFLFILVLKKKTLISLLRKAIFAEGAYYLFILPFIIYLFTKPYNSTAAQTIGVQAGLSYALQILLISPAFFILYSRLRKPNLDLPKSLKWGAIGIVGFVFALWIKHFLLNIYALPINIADGNLVVGLLNSTFTILAAALLLLFALLPLIKEKSLWFNSTIAGIGLILIGIYFLVYLAVAFFNEGYSSFLGLTEIWAITMPVAGLGLIQKTKDKD